MQDLGGRVCVYIFTSVTILGGPLGPPGAPGGWESEFFASSFGSPSGRPKILDLSSKTLDFSILHKSKIRKIGIFDVFKRELNNSVCKFELSVKNCTWGWVQNMFF